MGARTGAEYIDSLRDHREIWANGQRVEDVTTFEPFAGSIRGMAGYFDYQHRYAADCLDGDGLSVSHLVPSSLEDLHTRQRALERLSRYSMGMLGRTPDYVNVTFAGYAGLRDTWSATGNDAGYDNLVRFQREVATRDLALTHSIVHPVVDRRIAEFAGINRELALRKVGETSDSIVVSGARLLATLGPFADEMAVYPGTPIGPEDADLALAFSVPMNTPGMKILCRDHFGGSGSRFDRPFSTRFDEQDAFVVFDEVHVPKARVFCDGFPAVYNGARANGWIANIMQQTTTRALVKLQFAYELCVRMAELTGQLEREETAAQLGELWSYGEITRATLTGALAGARDYGNGTWFCDEGPFVALRPTMPGWMSRVNEIIKTIGSQNLLVTPAEADFADSSIGQLIDRYLLSADGTDARERTRVFRTAWDFVGSALGGRIELYERLYLASASRTFRIAQRWAQERPGDSMLEEFFQQVDTE